MRAAAPRPLARPLLLAGIAAPILYFANLLISPLFYPGYSHVRQYASELGSPDAPHPAIFNTTTVLVGVAMLLGAAGVLLALRQLTGRRVLAVLAGLLLGAFGASLVLGGLFPMPDPRHGAFGLGFAVVAAPVPIAIAVWNRRDLHALRAFLVAITLAMVVLLAIMMGVGQLVTRSNVGVFQRLFALTIFPWIGITAYALRRRLAGTER